MISAIALAIVVAQQSFPVATRILLTTPPAIELTNTGAQPITAWSVAVVSPNTQGGTHRETHTADVYLSEVTRDLPRAPQHLDWLQPGKSVRVPIDAAPASASVEVVALVYADRSAAGDPKTVQTFFEHRHVERDQLRDVSATLDSVLKTEHGLAALHALEERFANANADSIPHRTARDAVAVYLAQAGRGGEADASADEQIRQYAAFVKKQYELAVQHAEPRR